MSEQTSMSRESKKRQLRQGMISSEGSQTGPRRQGTVSPEGSQTGPRRQGMVSPEGSQTGPRRRELPSDWEGEEGREQAVPRRSGRLARRRLLILALAAVVAGCCGAGVFYYRRNHHFTSYETVWEETLNEGSLVGYRSLGTNVLKYTRDGASYVDDRGKTVWTESYEMKSPVAVVNGDYAAIADQQGNSIHIYSVAGKQGEAKTALPISKVTVAGNGVVAAVLEDSVSSYIAFFRRDGNQLDITIKSNMGGDGYPLALAFSRDGKQLMCSYVQLAGGELKNCVVFYDFSEIGQNIPTRVVGQFDKMFEGTMVPQVVYLKEPYSCAFSGNGPVFFSSRNLASPEMVAQVPIEEEEIESIFYSDEYVALIVRNNSGENPNRLEVYEADGTHVFSRDFIFDYLYADIDGDLIILYNEDSCRIYNMSGVEKLYAQFDFPVAKIRRGRLPDTLLLTGAQQIREVRLR